MQRQLASTWKAEARYFGSHGVRISSQLIDNVAVYPAPGPIAPRLLWPQFPAYVDNGYNGYRSFYDGLSLVLGKTVFQRIADFGQLHLVESHRLCR